MIPPTRNGAPLIVGDTTFIAGLEPPALDQPILNKVTGEIKVGDGESRPGDLAAVPTPGGGGAALTFPSGTGGLANGYLGVEYDGSAIAIGADPAEALFDTSYTDPDSGASAALTDPVETDDWTFATTGITPKFTGAAWVYMECDVSATTEPFKVNWQGMNGPAPYFEVGIGGRFASIGPILLPVVAERQLKFEYTGTADETATVLYMSIAVVKAAD